jgi:hypothetical protein
MLGGAVDPGVASLDDGVLVRLVREELGKLMSLDAQPPSHALEEQRDEGRRCPSSTPGPTSPRRLSHLIRT